MVSLTKRKSHDGGKTKNVKINRKSYNLPRIFPLLISESGGGNPTARPWLVRIWGMLGALLITLGFIAIIIYLQKRLPDGSKSRFHPSWKRNAVAREGVVAHDPSFASQILSFAGVGTPIPGRSTSFTLEYQNPDRL